MTDSTDQDLRDAGFTDDQIAQAHVPISAGEMDAHEEAHKDDADRQFYHDRDKRRQADAAIGPERENELLTEATASAKMRGVQIGGLCRQVQQLQTGPASPVDVRSDILAAVWSEGFEAGARAQFMSNPAPNPFRNALAGPVGKRTGSADLPGAEPWDTTEGADLDAAVQTPPEDSGFVPCLKRRPSGGSHCRFHLGHTGQHCDSGLDSEEGYWFGSGKWECGYVWEDLECELETGHYGDHWQPVDGGSRHGRPWSNGG